VTDTTVKIGSFTLNGAFIILDEAQNTTPEQMKMFLTRLGFGSKVVVNGDVTQIDLPAGQISDIAIHPTDSSTVYVTTSNLIFSEGAGEFTNDHGSHNRRARRGQPVHRLAQANPVNAVVIDPQSRHDFHWLRRRHLPLDQWRHGADDGLPNRSQDPKSLPEVLLRGHARPLHLGTADAATIPLTDIYLRDDVLDTGLAPWLRA
jgi:hypothetical protein